MQVQHVGHKIRGFYRVADYALRWGMIAPDAQKRLAILDFWQRKTPRLLSPVQFLHQNHQCNMYWPDR
jgi:uncharacterized protein Usg